METWPSFYPENVPPDDAHDTVGVAYRIVDSIPPQRSDFKSTYEENPRDYGDDLWKACGTSLHTEIEGARKTRARYPKLREKMIVTGEMVESLGKMKQTPSKLSVTHITAWFKLNSDPENYIKDNAE